VALPIEASELRASRNAEALAALVDGNQGTAWDTGGPQQPGDFLEVRWPTPVRLGRVELVLGRRSADRAGALQLLASPDGRAWTAVPFVAGRAAVADQVSRPASQVLLLEPLEVRGLRLVLTGARRRAWAVAELRAWGPAESPRPPP
jgi:hypothetical protein